MPTTGTTEKYGSSPEVHHIAISTCSNKINGYLSIRQKVGSLHVTSGAAVSIVG